MQNACWHLPSRGKRSLRASTSVGLEADPVVRPPRELDEVGALRGTGRGRCRPRSGPPGRRGRRSATARARRRRTRSGRRASRRDRPSSGRRARRSPVGIVERREQLLLVHLGRRHGEREPVAVAERVGGRVAQPRELADVLCDERAHRLRRDPRSAPLLDVVAVAEDPADLVVVDRASVELRPDAARSASRPTPRAR